ncbi:MAG: dipeptidase, partial [Bacteroidota bacterium]
LILPACNNAKEESIADKASRIHAKVLTVDSHVDTPMRLTHSGFDIGKYHDVNDEKSRVDFPRMKEGGLDAVFFAIFTGQGKRTTEGNEKVKNYAIEISDSIHSALKKYSNLAQLALTPKDAYNAEKEGKRAIFIGMENGYPIGNDISLVSEYYNLGVRYITLCHSKNNDICDSSTDTTEHNGLSVFGAEVVEEMNNLGMMIDVSHASDSSFYDVIKLSKSPIIASHSCSRTLCDNPRNLTDEMLKLLAKNNGVIQLCILSDYVKKPDPNPKRDSCQQVVRKKYRFFQDLSNNEMVNARKDWYAIDTIYPAKYAKVSDAVNHIDHIVDVIGIEHIGIGTDFDGGGGLEDCVDVSQLGNITLELVKRGYSEEDIEKIWGGNIMRVMQEVANNAN